MLCVGTPNSFQNSYLVRAPFNVPISQEKTRQEIINLWINNIRYISYENLNRVIFQEKTRQEIINLWITGNNIRYIS